jgi:hypothetical protein
VVGGTPQVNLLPQAVIARRAQSRTLKEWGVRIAGAVAVVAIACAGLFAWQSVTALQLLGVQQQGDELLTRIAAESEIQQLMRQQEELDRFRTEAMSTDLEWVPVLEGVKATFPDDASVGAYELRSGAVPSGAPEEQVGLSGTISVVGAFPSAIPFLRDFASVSGLSSATVREGKWDSSIDAYVHVIDVEFDQTVYSGRYAEEAEE